MIIKVNRTIVCTVLLLVLLCSIAFQYVNRRNAVSVLSFAKSSDMAVIIDAGHGGEDSGAVAADGTMEKNLNLDIARKLRDICELFGCTVYMTRETDQSLSGKSFHKNADMQKRIELTRTYPDAIFVSIHLNKFSMEQYSGAQVFYSGNHSKSERLAQTIQQAIHQHLQPNNTRQIKSGDENSILLRVIESPAVIVEGGFLSNANELSMLKTEEYRTKLAYCIFLGLIQYQHETDVT